MGEIQETRHGRKPARDALLAGEQDRAPLGRGDRIRLGVLITLTVAGSLGAVAAGAIWGLKIGLATFAGDVLVTVGLLLVF